MKPLLFQIKWLILLTIPGFGPAQAALQQDPRDHDTRRLGIGGDAFGGEFARLENCMTRTPPWSPEGISAPEALL